jgi:hypothetical protein
VRRALALAGLLAATACGGDPEPAPLVAGSCHLPSGGQCAVYTLPADWVYGARQECEWQAGTWGAACPVDGRVGTCTCTGSGGSSSVVHYYDLLWTAEEASASCAGLGCAWTAP